MWTAHIQDISAEAFVAPPQIMSLKPAWLLFRNPYSSKYHYSRVFFILSAIFPKLDVKEIDRRLPRSSGDFLHSLGIGAMMAFSPYP